LNKSWGGKLREEIAGKKKGKQKRMFSRIFKFSVFRSLVYQEGEVFFRNIVTFNNDNLRLDSARKKFQKTKKKQKKKRNKGEDICDTSTPFSGWKGKVTPIFASTNAFLW